jgi:hypothetical protein
MHSTGGGKESKVKHLILGHYFVMRYQSFKEKQISFLEVLLADDGRSFDFKQSQRLRKRLANSLDLQKKI